jgi:hypothetical protein
MSLFYGSIVHKMPPLNLRFILTIKASSKVVFLSIIFNFLVGVNAKIIALLSTAHAALLLSADRIG